MNNVIPLKAGAAQDGAGAARVAVRCVLMIEDDANDAELLRASLAEACGDGVEVLHARTLAEGLALQQSKDVQLTLLDLDLPDSTGFRTLERMRAAAAGPVVVVSGNAHPSLADEVLKRRAYDVIPKHELDTATLRRVLRLATLHHEAGRALRATEGRFRALLENSAEALVLIDAAGRVEYASASLRRVLGYESHEVVGRQGLGFVHAEDRDTVQAAFFRLRATPGASAVYRVRFTHKDGGVRLLESALVNRLADPEVAAIVCNYRDLTREEEHRARFDATFEHAAVGLAHIDLEGRILLANRRLCDMLGYARDELVGRTVSELSHPEDADAAGVSRERLRVGAIGQFTTRERYLRKDGATLWAQLSVSLQRGADGHPQYEIAALQDVSEAVRAELAARRLGRMYAALSATNEAILKTADAGTLYRRVCELLVEHGGLKLVAVRLVDEATGWIETAVHAGEPASYLAGARISVDREVPAAQGPTGMAVLEGRTVVSNDYLAEPRLAQWHESARKAGIAAMMGVPLRRAGKAIGLISLYSAETGWFDPALVELAERMAENVSFALDNLEREARRAQAQLALRASEERFRSLTEMSSDFYWETDTEHRFTQRGSGGKPSAVSSFQDGSMLGKRRWELPFLTPDLQGWMAHKAVLDARLPFRDFEFSRPARDGSERFITVSGEPTFDAAGAFTGYRGVGTDITERKRAANELRRSEERFRNLTELSSDLYWEQDAEFRFTRVTADPASPLFSDPSNALGKTRWELPLTPLSCSWEQHRETLRAQRSFREFEFGYPGADGKPRYASASGYPVFDAEGRFAGYRGMAKDISERKHAESRMRVHAERQAAIARFGQFALGRRSTEELYAAAAGALRCEGVDAVCLLEMFTERGEYLVRAAQGEGPHASLGMSGPIAPDSVWPEILRENAPRIAGREYLASRPLDRPWRAWLRGMGSVVYAPVRDDDKPIAMLCVYAVQERAFGAEDVRFAEAVGHVLSTALQRQKAEERLAHLAQFDPLTGLPNRTLLQDRLGQAVVQSRRRQGHAGVLFVDLDRFKLVNDTLGHHQGDALIRQVGQRLLACVRPGDTVGRISGDEFAVVLADLARADDAALVAQKILDALARPFDLGGNEAYVTASIGIAAFPEDGEDAETLLKNADMAMYRAKESARNSYCFFTAEMNRRTVAKVQLNTDLRRAIERQEFALHYQPKVELSSGALTGLEALLRWNHPARGLVPPAEFVPALEDSGLIVPVGEWVIAQACAQIRRWELAGLAPVPVAVNLSAKQFLRRDLDSAITRTLAAAGVPPRLLELEITESCLMDNPEEAVRALNALRQAGLKISVDDFGTGYSSLAYLARFPLSALKIDRAFVRDVHLEASAAAIVRAVIDMANNLGLLVVAEGVETEQQAAFLRRHGCHQGQGYLFSRPLPADDVAARLRAPAP